MSDLERTLLENARENAELFEKALVNAMTFVPDNYPHEWRVILFSLRQAAGAEVQAMRKELGA